MLVPGRRHHGRPATGADLPMRRGEYGNRPKGSRAVSGVDVRQEKSRRGKDLRPDNSAALAACGRAAMIAFQPPTPPDSSWPIRINPPTRRRFRSPAVYGWDSRLRPNYSPAPSGAASGSPLAARGHAALSARSSGPLSS
jgi:hypothetical protein